VKVHVGLFCGHKIASSAAPPVLVHDLAFDDLGVVLGKKKQHWGQGGPGNNGICFFETSFTAPAMKTFFFFFFLPLACFTVVSRPQNPFCQPSSGNLAALWARRWVRTIFGGQPLFFIIKFLH